ncbi:hypothetical protein EDB85DRAFT_394082 [Lactarius pseudohatsudake]|nr:hypothetical protein EDB85DRAFT_394082 [Lactarius pseudohatsudake]
MMQRKLVPCKFWLQGKCTFGDKCKNSHAAIGPDASRSATAAITVPIPATQAGTCPYFSKGTCRFGDQCRLSHRLAPETQTLPPGAAPKPFGPCKFFVQGRCSREDCPFDHILLNTVNTFPGPVRTIAEPDVPSPGQPSPKSMCRFFRQGQCTRPECPYLHETNGSSEEDGQSHSLLGPQRWPRGRNIEQRLTTIDASATNENPILPAVAEDDPDDSDSHGPPDETPVIRNYSGSEVHFGVGAIIQKLITPFESRTVVVSNVPADATRMAFIELAESFGDIKSLTCDGTSARIEYMDVSHAAYAVEGLSDHDIGPLTLSARFDLRAVAAGPATLRSTKVKVSWYSPSTVAWAHYPSLSKARSEAMRLNGTTFKGRKIHAKFQTPSLRQTTSFTVVLEGLPSLLPSDPVQLKALSRADHVAIGEPTYIKRVAVDRIRDLLTGHGHLDSFDVMPTSQANTKMTAWVQFAAAEDAAGAVDKLHNSRQYFLRNGPLWLEQIHAVRYLLPRAQFAALRSIIERLGATTDGCCQLRYYEHGEGGAPVDPVCVRIYGPDAKSLTWTKRALEKAIQGRRLTDSEGAVVWHDLFPTVKGKDLVDEVQGQTSAYIKCDPRLREVRICGEEQSIESATKQFLTKVKEFSSQERVIEVQKNWLKPLLSGGLRAIQEDFGEGAGTLLFDIVARTISVRGDDHTVMSVRRAIDRLVAKQVSNSEANSDTEEVCPVCFCETSDSESIALPCGHVYDTDCLRHLLKASIDTTFFDSLSCVMKEDDGKPCSTLIPLSIIRDILSPDEESRLFDTTFRSYVNSRPHDFHYCPTVDCPTIYRPGREGTVLLCPSCLERICPNCHAEYHEGLTCKEFKSGISENTELFNAWKAANGVKSCPGCDADIQKNGGCNHIRCTVCKIHICWVCMKTFKDDGDDEGVYPHMQAAHGGYGV